MIKSWRDKKLFNKKCYYKHQINFLKAHKNNNSNNSMPNNAFSFSANNKFSTNCKKKIYIYKATINEHNN